MVFPPTIRLSPLHLHLTKRNYQVKETARTDRNAPSWTRVCSGVTLALSKLTPDQLGEGGTALSLSQHTRDQRVCLCHRGLNTSSPIQPPPTCTASNLHLLQPILLQTDPPYTPPPYTPSPPDGTALHSTSSRRHLPTLHLLQTAPPYTPAPPPVCTSLHYSTSSSLLYIFLSESFFRVSAVFCGSV